MYILPKLGSGDGLPGTALFRDRSTGSERYRMGIAAAHQRAAYEMLEHLEEAILKNKRDGHPGSGDTE